MSKSRAASGIRAGAWLLLLVLAVAAPAGAQVQSVDTSQPIAVRPVPKGKRKFDKFSGQILSVDKQSIKVRGDGNYNVRTFAYTPKVGEKITRGLAKGHYANGQAVEIKYVRGSDIATGIRR